MLPAISLEPVSACNAYLIILALTAPYRVV
jgi:hypothetical protein